MYESGILSGRSSTESQRSAAWILLFCLLLWVGCDQSPPAAEGEVDVPVWAASFSEGVYFSSTGGVGWSALQNQVTGLKGFWKVLAPGSHPGEVYIGTSGAGVYRIEAHGEGPTALNSGLTNLEISDLQLSTDVPGLMLAATWGAGVFRTEDSGRSWRPSSDGMSRYYATCLAFDHRTPRTVYCGTSGGVFISHDAGRSWSAVDQTFPNPYFRCIAVEPVGEGGIWIGADGGDGRGVCYYSSDGGSSWERQDRGLGHHGVTCLAISSQDATVYAGTDAGVFFRPSDSSSWRRFGRGLARTRVHSLAVDAESGTLFMGCSEGVLRCRGAYRKWELVREGLPQTSITGVAVASPRPSG